MEESPPLLDGRQLFLKRISAGGAAVAQTEPDHQKDSIRRTRSPKRGTHSWMRLLLSFATAAVLFGFAYLLFDIRIHGGLLAALVVFLAANVTFGGIAILVAARPTKTQVGNGVINFVPLTMLMLLSIFFSYATLCRPGWCVPSNTCHSPWPPTRCGAYSTKAPA